MPYVERDLGSGSTKGLEDYHEILSKIISMLDIHKAVAEKKVQADIMSSGVLEKAPKIILPLADSHKEIINRVWEDNSSLAVFKQSLTERYHIIESDFENFCKMGSLENILSHALHRSGVPTTSAKGKGFECIVSKTSSLAATITVV